MSMSEEEVQQRFPIHWLVWNKHYESLESSLRDNQYTNEELELKDPRGRTPLMLAVTLGHTDAVRLLLDAGADANCEKDGWTAVQEATSTGDVELLSLVLSRRDYQRQVARAVGVPELLNKLSMAPDFYVEMKWEFTSWVPLVSRMCPFDTYRVYKRGGNVRVDTTLVGFENNRWQRGDRTYIFNGQGTSATLTELDHVSGTRWSEVSDGAPPRPGAAATAAAKRRMKAAIAINYLHTDNISFERNKCGIWGWRQDKTEAVNGYECKVFSASNVELVSKTRTEHLGKGQRDLSPRAPFAGLLALSDENEDGEHEEESDDADLIDRRETEDIEAETIAPVTWQEYFSETPMERDIGRPKKMETKVQKFKANLWLCEDYPLQLQEQIMPILDLMATMSSPHFTKLKDFIQMQLPAGFPVKIEIPLFHVLNARVTFGNIFACERDVPRVMCLKEGDRLSCVVDDENFAVPPGYRDLANEARSPLDDEESLLQYAIQQSLHDEHQQIDVWEALRARPVSPRPPNEDPQLQRAIEASLRNLSIAEQPLETAVDPELMAALQLSALEQDRREREREAEQLALDEAIRLSLVDK